MEKLPSSSRFSITVPINYEDTDAGGIVYYGNYLSYMERARNACLRQAGYPLGVLVEEFGVLFVVTDARLKYIQPGRLDDALEITLGVKSIRGASIIFEQNVLRENTKLVEAEIKLAVLQSETFRPKKLPSFLVNALSQWKIVENLS
ncbi:MAG: YbgC/FadM family acyl-CoA thioesterase [Gammaproteobacteria bacterium]|nr:YbgC/FadM family acyl-CoA thioesterase [Gammaproteobacteria bacterium]